MRRVESSEGVRLEGSRCAIGIRRLKPGAVLVTITGDDAGELGTAPHDELDREIARYGPLELRVDARAVSGVGLEVAEAWTSFLRRRGGAVRGAVLLVGSRQVALSARSAAALAGAARVVTVTDDAAAFDAEVARLEPPGPRPPGHVVKREAGREGVTLSAGGLRATVGRLGAAADVVLAGFDGGQLCAPMFDAIADVLAGGERWEIFLDARACSGVAGRSADAWAAWMGAHRDRLAAVHVFATAPAVRLALGLEGEIGGMRPFLRVHTEPEAFARARTAARQ